MRYIKHVESMLRLFPDAPEPSEPVCKPRSVNLPNARPVPWPAGYRGWRVALARRNRDSLDAMARWVPRLIDCHGLSSILACRVPGLVAMACRDRDSLGAMVCRASWLAGYPGDDRLLDDLSGDDLSTDDLLPEGRIWLGAWRFSERGLGFWQPARGFGPC